MTRLRAPILIWSGWFIFLLVLTVIYVLNPSIKDYINIVLTFFIVVVMFLQAQILKDQTKLLASPIIDANARIKVDGNVQLQVANVGNYTAKDPKIVVEIDTPDTIYRYICKIFPSLPPRSMYTSGTSRNYFEIKPLFWIPESENSRISGGILELMDYLCKIGYSEEIVKITIYLQASNHETVRLFTEEITPSNFRDFVAGRVRCVCVEVLPRNPIKKLWYIYQKRRKEKKVEELSEDIQLNISKLS